MNISRAQKKLSNWYKLIKKYVPVTLYLSQTTMKKEASTTLGGVLWWLLDPLLYCMIYYFVFAVIFESKTDNFIAFLLLGLIIFRWVSVSLLQSSGAVRRARPLMRQLDIPKVIWPLQIMIVQFIKFMVAFFAILIILAVLGAINFSALYALPIAMGAGFVLVTGGSLLISALTPLFPDLKNILQITMTALRYVSAIFFEISQVPEKYRFWVEINPMTVIVTTIRDVILYGTIPGVIALSYMLILGSIAGGIGIYMHKRFNRVYPRLIV